MGSGAVGLEKKIVSDMGELIGVHGAKDQIQSMKMKKLLMHVLINVNIGAIKFI
jgi:hypothetical protein